MAPPPSTPPAAPPQAVASAAPADAPVGEPLSGPAPEPAAEGLAHPSPQTQPIQIHPYTGEALPASLGAGVGQETYFGGAVPDAALPPSPTEAQRVRLQLDRLGEGGAARSPDDFIVHAPETASPVPAPASLATDETAPPELAEAASPATAPEPEEAPSYGQPIENLVVEPEYANLDTAPLDYQRPVEPEPLPDESFSSMPPAEAAQTQETSLDAPDHLPNAEPAGSAYPGSGHAEPEYSDPLAGTEIDAASPGPLSPPPAEGQPTEEAPPWQAAPSAEGPAEDRFDDLFFDDLSAETPEVTDAGPPTRREEIPAGVGEFLAAPREEASHEAASDDAAPTPTETPTAPGAAKSHRRGGDVDEMLGLLGDDEEVAGMATSTKIILVSLVVVSLIAVGAAYFLARSLGFFAGDDRPAAAAADIVRSDSEVPALVEERLAALPESPGAPLDAPAEDRAAQAPESPAEPGPDRAYADGDAGALADGANATDLSSPTNGALASLDERVQALVGDPTINPDASRPGSLIGSGPSLDPIVSEPTDFSGIGSSQLSGSDGAAAPAYPGAPPTDSPGDTPSAAAPGDVPEVPETVPALDPAAEPSPLAAAGIDPPSDAAPEGASAAAPSGARRNYNPPESFPAPGPDDGPLGRTHDLLDAFLRAPDLDTRLRYAYQGESLRPAMEEYYRKWPFATADRYRKTLFQIDDNPESGGPYWVYLISSSDAEEGFPVIIRVEDGLLKVDWEVYAEFQDRHFGRFLSSSVGSTGTFRLVIDRKSGYYGPDQATFPDLDRYLVYEINPPYGDLNEYSKYAFVEKDSELGRKLDDAVGLGADALAVILTLEIRTFPHGARHFVITDYVTDGWFR